MRSRRASVCARSRGVYRAAQSDGPGARRGLMSHAYRPRKQAERIEPLPMSDEVSSSGAIVLTTAAEERAMAAAR